jgi:hypothetical protein
LIQEYREIRASVQAEKDNAMIWDKVTSAQAASPIAAHALLTALLLAADVFAYAATAMAADPTRPDARFEPGAGRYTMHPAEGGFLRLDTQTGQMSMCKSASATWSCASLPDERSALEAKSDALQRENQELKSAVKRLEELAGVAPGDQSRRDGKSGSGSGPGAQLPSEDDVDKAMSYVQRMLKKFKEKIREFEDLDKKGTNL